MWYVYIVKCADSTLYTGITKDVERRVKEHNTSKRGAKSVRYRKPVAVVYRKAYNTHEEAAKREYEIKSWNKIEKLKLIKGFSGA